MPSIADAETLDVETSVPWFVDQLGRERFEKRVSDLRSRMENAPFSRESTIERHHVELCISEGLQVLSETGQLGPLRQPYLDAFWFASLANAANNLLTDKGKKRHLGRLKQALGEDYGFAAIRTEYTAMLLGDTLGARVDPMDFEGNARFDFLFEKDGEEIEMECKLMTHDFGNDLSYSAFQRLGAAFEKYEMPLVERLGKCVVVRVEVEQLPAGDSALREIAKSIGQRIELAATKISSPISSLQVEDWDAGRVDPARAHSEARFLMLLEHFHTMAFVRSSAAVVLGIRVADPDGQQFKSSVLRKFKDAADQLSGSRPGVIFAEFEGPCVDNVRNEEVARMFKRILEDFFPARPTVHLVKLCFAGPPFSAGASYPIRNPRKKRRNQGYLLRSLENASRMKGKTRSIPGREFRFEWWKKKYDWSYKMEEKLPSSLGKKAGG